MMCTSIARSPCARGDCTQGPTIGVSAVGRRMEKAGMGYIHVERGECAVQLQRELAASSACVQFDRPVRDVDIEVI